MKRFLLAVALVGCFACGWSAAAVNQTGSVTHLSLVYRRVGGDALGLDAFIPSRSGRLPLIVFVHGGGWRSGNRSSFAKSAQQVTRLGWVGVSIDYRLDQASRFPAAVSDVLAAVVWARSHARLLHADPGRIGLVGASAGGHLVALAATEGAPVHAVVSWSGPMDLTLFGSESTNHWADAMVAEFIGCPLSACRTRYVAASPALHVSSQTPPMLIANSSNEIVPLAQAQEMSQALTHAHVEHQLIVYAGSRHATGYEISVWQPTVAFLRRHLAPS